MRDLDETVCRSHVFGGRSGVPARVIVSKNQRVSVQVHGGLEDLSWTKQSTVFGAAIEDSLVQETITLVEIQSLQHLDFGCSAYRLKQFDGRLGVTQGIGDAIGRSQTERMIIG